MWCLYQVKATNRHENTDWYLYFAFVRPKLEYACIVWDDWSDTDKIRLEDMQLRFARTVTGAKWDTNHQNIYDEIDWPLLSERRTNYKLKFIKHTRCRVWLFTSTSCMLHNQLHLYVEHSLPLQLLTEPVNLSLCKKMHHCAPPYLTDLIPDHVRDKINHNLRNKDDLRNNHPRTEKYKHSRFMDGVRLWNEPPDYIKK